MSLEVDGDNTESRIAFLRLLAATSPDGLVSRAEYSLAWNSNPNRLPPIDPSHPYTTVMIGDIKHNVNKLVCMFEQRWRTGLAEDTATRSTAVQTAAKCRDGKRCVITGHPSVQAAHIVPHYMIRRNQRSKPDRVWFWDFIEALWGPEFTTECKTALFGDTGSLEGHESEENILSLSPTLHQHWSEAGFALKPGDRVYERGGEVLYRLELEYLHLRRNPGESIHDRVDPAFQPAVDAEPLGWPAQNGLNLLQPNSQNVPIRSGDRFEITNRCSNERHDHILPNPVLLELAFRIHKICWMAGAGDPAFLDPEPEDDSEDDAQE